MSYKTFTKTITTSATPDYASGDAIGTGYLTLEGVCNTAGKTAQLCNVTVKDAAGQAPTLVLLFFKVAPGGTYTDNDAVNLSAADLEACVGQISVLNANYITTDSYSIITMSELNMVMNASPGYDLYVVAVAKGAYNASGTSDLTIEFGFEVAP